MGLCCACLGISSSGLFDRYTEPPSTEQPWEYVHLQEASLLPSSATSCPLCSLIVESLIDQLQLSNRDSWEVLYQHLNGPLRIQLHASDMLLYVQYKGDGPDRVISSRLCASIKRGNIPIYLTVISSDPALFQVALLPRICTFTDSQL